MIFGHGMKLSTKRQGAQGKLLVAIDRKGEAGDALGEAMSVAYNDYVLTTSLDQGWIQPEQANQVRVVIAANPQVAALDLMEEQQLLPAEHVQVLRGLIEQAGGSSAVQDSSVVRAYLERAVQMGASDLHLGPDAPALVRIFGQLTPLEGANARHLSKEETEQLARSFLLPKQVTKVE